MANHTRFTYKIYDKRVNTKTIQQLIDEFKAEKEVSAACQAHALHGKCSGLATHGDYSKKSLYDVKTDVEEPPNKQKRSNSSSATPAKAKPPASAAVCKASKDSDIPEVKNLDDDELDYEMMLMMMLLVMAPTSHWGHSMKIRLKTQTRLLNRTVMTDPLGTDLLNAQMVTIRDLRIDPGADLAADHTKDHRVPHPMKRVVLKIEADHDHWAY